MSLFGDLPPPSAHLRPKQENREEEYKPKPLIENTPGSEGEGDDPADHDVHDRPEKRQRVEDAKSSGILSKEQIAAALAKIGSHISNPDKFSKAAGLLRHMLDSGALTKTHRDQLFEVVKAAFSDFDNASEASLRRDYMKLCHSLDKRAEGLLSRAQRAQLEVYRIVGFLQNEMHTDDSFVFNKVLGRLKDAVAALPTATEEDEEALAELQDAAAGSDEERSTDDGGDGSERQQHGGRNAPNTTGHTVALGKGGRGEEAAALAGPTAAAGTSKPQVEMKEEQPPAAGPERAQEDVEDDAEADPFGLEQLLPAPKRPQAPPPPPPPPQLHHPGEEAGDGQHSIGGGGKSRSSNAWTTSQTLVMRRQALIECLITSRGFHKTPWARTSVELFVEHYNKHRDRFTTEQLVAVDEMVRFVRAARQARPTGPSQKEINRDTTSFERARSDWSRATLSARGKVGASGDAKSQNWLG